MGASVPDDYCPFTKAIEHLGDRWSLLIVRQLGIVGPLGFNALATGLPGRISRSVLAERLRRLEELGLIGRGSPNDREVPYHLTASGLGLMPMLLELRRWAANWLPEDPAMVERDPGILAGWLARRLDRAMLPGREVVLEVRSRGPGESRGWLVLRRGAEPYGCLEDPLLDEARYVFVEAGTPVLLAIARGRLDWAGAIRDATVIVSGDPALTKLLPIWFRPAGSEKAGETGEAIRVDRVGSSPAVLRTPVENAPLAARTTER
ncbi:MAG: winged helix-turn-helix transcriptional regulator [Nocardioidaceae bacterium]